jgi:hypothetical protein
MDERRLARLEPARRVRAGEHEVEPEIAVWISIVQVILHPRLEHFQAAAGRRR